MPNFIEITLWHGCSPVNMLQNFRALSLATPLGGFLFNILNLFPKLIDFNKFTCT